MMPNLLAMAVEYADCTSAEKTHPLSVLGMILNWFWWWGSSHGALGNIENLFIDITPNPTLTCIGSTC